MVTSWPFQGPFGSEKNSVKRERREREREKGNFQDRIFQLGPGNDPPSAREPRCRVARFYRVFLPGFSAPVPANRFFLDPTAIYRVWVDYPKVYRVTEFYRVLPHPSIY